MVFVNHCSLCFAKQLPSEVGLHQDDFSDEKSVLTVLSEKLQYLSFSQVPAGSDCSLSCLYCNRFSYLIFYSPSLRRGSVGTGGLRLLSFMPILHHSLQLFYFYSPSLCRGSVGTDGLRLLSFMPILHHSLQLFDFYSPSLRRSSVSTGGLRLPPITGLCCIRAAFSY